uniref:c-Myc-binding protein-like n=1 Tax=Scophthalmus maximus TaxID=52904 RepID=A0A8D3B8K0_SCOMX
MAHYRASESKREQFRRYLEKSGVLDTITSVLVALYEETDKPNNALDFIKLHLGGAGPDPAEAEAAALRVELADLQQKCNLLMEENKELQDKVRCRLDLQISRGFERVSTVTYNLHLIITSSCCSMNRRLRRKWQSEESFCHWKKIKEKH